MKKIDFPLICYPLREDLVLGLLVGTDYQVVEQSVKKVKTVLSGYLRKRYKKEGEYPLLEIRDPSLRNIDLTIRPTYRSAGAAFPLKTQVKLSMPLVYGEEEPGVYDCYLPLLEENFYCYDLKQLDPLARHFIKNSMDDMYPEEIFRMSTYPKPKLDFISLKFNENPTFNFDWNFQEKPKILSRLAEPYPLPKAVKRNLRPLPDAAWEMEEVIEDAVDRLLRQRASLLLCGQSGTGKSAVLRAAFRKLHTISKKQDLQLSFWRIRAQRITATSKYLGEWQEAVEELIAELDRFNGVLWVEEVVQLLREGSSSVENSVAAYILPFIQSGKLQMVGEVTPQELESLRRMLPGFAESLQVIDIPELPESRIHAVFQKLTEYVQQNLKIQVTPDALSTAFRLLKRFYPYERFPGKGIRLIEECIANVQFEGTGKIGKRQVLDQFIRRTGLPDLFLRDDLLLDQQELQQFFSHRIIGQQEAVDQLCNIVKVFKAGLNNPFKPITTMIFAGPTGVGKTASAKAIADYFFGKGQQQLPLIRIDMSEFQHTSQITKFIGEGKEPGKLVKDVRERPFAVLLLDEAEKAAPSIFDAFMTVLDEGLLVDSFGRVTNFRNCIIILTTNLGASNQRSIGYASEVNEAAVYRGAIGRFFRPEFINRIDHIIVFNSLQQKDIRRITVKELEGIKQREGFTKRGLTLEFTPAVINFLSEAGFHEKYGARPLQRALEDKLIKPLAKWMLLHPDVQHSKLVIDYKDELTVSAERPV